MPVVVDASVSAAWYLADEATPYTSGVLDLLQRTGAVVPPIWTLEIASVMLTAERRQRVSLAQVTRILETLRTLPIEVDDQPLTNVWGSTMLLARNHDLSIYDASYLDLAVRRGIGLATQDRRLRDAAARLGARFVEDGAG